MPKRTMRTVKVLRDGYVRGNARKGDVLNVRLSDQELQNLEAAKAAKAMKMVEEKSKSSETTGDGKDDSSDAKS